MSENDDATTDWVTIERTLDAPPEVVWRMWTDPEHLKEWYGPDSASVPVADLDVRVGGRRLICMEMPTPDGPMQMWFTGEFREVDEPTRLIYTDAMSDERGSPIPALGMPPGQSPTTEVIVDLEPAGLGTRMTMTHVGVPTGSGGEGGWAMAFDKLAARVTST